MKFTIKNVLRIILVLSCTSATQLKPAEELQNVQNNPQQDVQAINFLPAPNLHELAAIGLLLNDRFFQNNNPANVIKEEEEEEENKDGYLWGN